MDSRKETARPILDYGRPEPPRWRMRLRGWLEGPGFLRRIRRRYLWAAAIILGACLGVLWRVSDAERSELRRYREASLRQHADLAAYSSGLQRLTLPAGYWLLETDVDTGKRVRGGRTLVLSTGQGSLQHVYPELRKDYRQERFGLWRTNRFVVEGPSPTEAKKARCEMIWHLTEDLARQVAGQFRSQGPRIQYLPVVPNLVDYTATTAVVEFAHGTTIITASYGTNWGPGEDQGQLSNRVNIWIERVHHVERQR